jgi:hypothetical protein
VEAQLRDSADAQVLLDGKTIAMHGELIQDREVVADLYRRCSECYGLELLAQPLHEAQQLCVM